MIKREWPIVQGDDEYFRILFPDGVDPADYVADLVMSPGVSGQTIAEPTTAGQFIVWRLPGAFTAALTGVQRYACRLAKDEDGDDARGLDEDQSTIIAGRVSLRSAP